MFLLGYVLCFLRVITVVAVSTTQTSIITTNLTATPMKTSPFKETKTETGTPDLSTLSETSINSMPSEIATQSSTSDSVSSTIKSTEGETSTASSDGEETRTTINPTSYSTTISTTSFPISSEITTATTESTSRDTSSESTTMTSDTSSESTTMTTTPPALSPLNITISSTTDLTTQQSTISSVTTNTETFISTFDNSPISTQSTVSQTMTTEQATTQTTTLPTTKKSTTQNTITPDATFPTKTTEKRATSGTTLIKNETETLTTITTEILTSNATISEMESTSVPKESTTELLTTTSDTTTIETSTVSTTSTEESTTAAETGNTEEQTTSEATVTQTYTNETETTDKPTTEATTTNSTYYTETITSAEFTAIKTSSETSTKEGSSTSIPTAPTSQTTTIRSTHVSTTPTISSTQVSTSSKQTSTLIIPTTTTTTSSTYMSTEEEKSSPKETTETTTTENTTPSTTEMTSALTPSTTEITAPSTTEMTSALTPSTTEITAPSTTEMTSALTPSTTEITAPSTTEMTSALTPSTTEITAPSTTEMTPTLTPSTTEITTPSTTEMTSALTPSTAEITIPSTTTEITTTEIAIPSTMTKMTSTLTLPLSSESTTTAQIITTTQLPSTIQVVTNLMVNLTSSPIIEGKDGVIACSFPKYNTSDSAKISWMKDGVTLQSPAFTKIQCHSSSCNSTLMLLQISILVRGQYTCNVAVDEPGIYYNGTANINIEMKQTPFLVMNPISASVVENKNININCYIRNKDKAYIESNSTIIKLCFNNYTEISSTTGSGYNQTYVLTALRGSKSYNISCGLGSCTYLGKFSNITVVKPEAKLCEGDKEWPNTQSGHEATAPCPVNYTGTQTRKCSSGGRWESPVRDSCKQEELEKVENALNTMNDTDEIPGDVIESSLSTISKIVDSTSTTDEKTSIAHVNIIQSVDLISKISDKSINFTDFKAAETTTKTFMGVVSNLLDTGTDRVKNTTKEKEVTGQILSSVNGFAKSVTKSLSVNQTVTVKKEHLLLSIEKIPKQEIVFPKETENLTDSVTQFTLPESALQSINDSSVAFTAVKYDNLGSKFDTEKKTGKNSTIDSSVLSLTVDNLNANLTDNITLTFQRISRNVSANSSISECVYLYEPKHLWNKTGCSVNITLSDSSLTVCECNHLTNFAILMSLEDDDDGPQISEEDQKWLTMISIVGCSFSIVGSVATIAIYLYFWRYIKSRRSVLIINLCLALFFAYMLFLTAGNQTENETVCHVIAALLQYFFLAMFCIMLALGIDLAVAILDVFSSRSSSAFLLLLGWGLPAAIVGITLGATELHGIGNKTFCWLRNNALYGFIVPALIIISVNFVIVVLVMKTMFSSSFMVKKSLKEKTVSGLRGMSALLPVLGLTWVFGILSVDSNTLVFKYLFAIFNSLQGLFIFLFHVLLNNQVRHAMSRKIRKYESRTLTTRTSKNKLVTKSSSRELYSDEESKDFRKHSEGSIIPRITLSNAVRRGTSTPF